MMAGVVISLGHDASMIQLIVQVVDVKNVEPMNRRFQEGGGMNRIVRCFTKCGRNGFLEQVLE